MPFVIVKRGSEYCVFTQSKPGGGPKGSPHGCHPTREKATAQLRALYANVPDARMSAAPCCPGCADSEFAALFNLPAEGGGAGEWVTYPTSHLFTAGEYEDKKFSATLEDLTALLEMDTPVPIQVEHVDSVFDGKLGDVLPTAVDAEGRLLGEVRIPRWLDGLLGPDERQLSCVFDRATKGLVKVGLVLSPRVTGAAMMAAFARRHDTPHGQRAMQEMHDHAASLGAVCSPGSANMASRHEHTAIQHIHDTAVEHGAQCAALGSLSNNPALPAFYSSNDPAREGKEKRMGFRDTVMRWLGQGAPEDFDPAAGAGTGTADFAAERATLTAARDAEKAAREKAEKALVAAFNDRGSGYVADSIRLGIPKASAEAVVATFAATGDYDGLKALADQQREAAVARFGRGPSANVTRATDDAPEGNDSPAMAAALRAAKRTGEAERARNGK